MIRRLDSGQRGFKSELHALVRGDAGVEDELQRQVGAIIADVRSRGDAAVLEYTRRFDQRASVRSKQLELPQARLRAALEGLPAGLRTALEAAADRVRRYHGQQRQDDWEITDELGNRLGQRVTPLERVGVYVPGGKASYPSSVLMNALPARVAGVREIIMVVPAPAGAVNDLVLAAACLAGVDRVITIGGAQAVAALAYGTESVPSVDKIVGPGNRYVAEAKRQVFGRVGIDMVAGPSEVLIIADASADPAWLAQDLFAQAEHDENAQAVLVSPDSGLLDAVEAALQRMLPGEPRAAIIEASLRQRGALVAVPDLPAAAEVSNSIAPEHLELAVADPRALLPRIRSAGAIFLGHYSSESLGDYCAGPNHVLPTGGSARFFSPLGVYDFQKRSSIIECTPGGAAALAGVAATLARGESLEAHARSAELRSTPG